MTQVEMPAVWMAVAGGLGGLLNAITSHNVFLWPTRIAVSPRIRVVRPGLAINVLTGGVAALGTYEAFAGVAGARGAVMPSMTLGLAWVVALALGALAARWLTSEADKRLLRAAACRACTAPAAHPDTAATMEFAPPYEVYKTAETLALRFRVFE